MPENPVHICHHQTQGHLQLQTEDQVVMDIMLPAAEVNIPDHIILPTTVQLRTEEIAEVKIHILVTDIKVAIIQQQNQEDRTLQVIVNPVRQQCLLTTEDRTAIIQVKEEAAAVTVLRGQVHSLHIQDLLLLQVAVLHPVNTEDHHQAAIPVVQAQDILQAGHRAAVAHHILQDLRAEVILQAQVVHQDLVQDHHQQEEDKAMA